jgi:hypothetical protein
VSRDWARWHDGYGDPSSPLSRRLAIVQAHLSGAITAAPPGPVRVVSLCAGQGHDVLGVLPGHARRDDVTAVLVDLDPLNARLAADRAAAESLAGVEVREADAGVTASYADAIPADVLLLCGIFGNVSDEDIRRTVGAAPALCAPGGTVIWTRHRRPPDLTLEVREWFAAAGFAEVAFEAPETGSTLIGVGVHRRPAGLAGDSPATSPPGGRLFAFTASS